MPAPDYAKGSHTDTDVLIVGAGAAALEAAHTLADHRITSIILEAQARIGGRIWTQQNNGFPPKEKGALQIHGEDAVTFNVLQRHNIAWQAVPNEGHTYIGNKLTQDRHSPLPPTEVLIGSLLQEAKDYLEKGGQDIGIIAFVDLVADRLPGVSNVRKGKRLLKNLLRNEFASNDVSLSALVSEQVSYCVPNFIIPNGYGEMTERMAQETSVDTRTQTPVQSIRWGQDGVTAKAKNGQTFHGSQAIITVPFGVLKEKRLKFSPALPPKTRHAIEDLGAGKASKVFLETNEPVFDADVEAVRTKEESQLLTIRRSNDSHATLWAHIGGRTYDSPDALRAVLRYDIRKMASLDHHRSCVPDDVVSWEKLEYFRCAYSYHERGIQRDCRAELAKSIGHILFFAGEATHSKNPGTVHGALESGIRAAQEIIALRVPTPPPPLSSLIPQVRAW